MTTPTTHFGFQKPVVGGDADTWGTELNAALDGVDSALFGVQTQANQAAPTGMLGDFDATTAPTGWVEHNGLTIGNASSNATGRANADAAPLFANQWAFSNTLRPIINSDGTPGTRGVDAPTDFAANKAITLANRQDRVNRAHKSGGLGPAIGDVQADAGVAHTHTIAYGDSGSGGSTGIAARGDVNINETIVTANQSPGGATETRVKSYGVLACIKL